jgi:hypothetical protein
MITNGLERRSYPVVLNAAELAVLKHRALQAQMSLGNLIRVALGLPSRRPGKASDDDLEKQADEAWSLLQAEGLNPADYFDR